MNSITVAWGVVASETTEGIFTNLWKTLIGQLHGPLAFRLILQPSVAVILASPRRIERLASRSARLFLALLIDSEHRKDLLPEGWKDVGKIFAVAVVLDVICQLIVLRWSILAKLCWSRQPWPFFRI